MFFKRITIIGAVTALIFATAAPALAGGEANDRPLRGTWTGHTVTADGVACPPGTWPGRTVGSGHATHFGRFEVVVESCTDLIGFATSGTASYTAANGDEVHVSFAGELTVNGDGSLTAVHRAAGAWGTGRFVNVSVNATDTVTGWPDGSAAGVLDGTIRFGRSPALR